MDFKKVLTIGLIVSLLSVQGVWLHDSIGGPESSGSHGDEDIFSELVDLATPHGLWRDDASKLLIDPQPLSSSAPQQVGTIVAGDFGELSETKMKSRRQIITSSGAEVGSLLAEAECLFEGGLRNPLNPKAPARCHDDQVTIAFSHPTFIEGGQAEGVAMVRAIEITTYSYHTFDISLKKVNGEWQVVDVEKGVDIFS